MLIISQIPLDIQLDSIRLDTDWIPRGYHLVIEEQAGER